MRTLTIAVLAIGVGCLSTTRRPASSAERRIAPTISMNTTAHSQRRVSLLGTVTDTKGRPLKGVRVFLNETPFGSVSDSLGQYELLGVPDGQYNVVISRVQFFTQCQDVVLSREHPETLSVTLRFDPRPVQ